MYSFSNNTVKNSYLLTKDTNRNARRKSRLGTIRASLALARNPPVSEGSSYSNSAPNSARKTSGLSEKNANKPTATLQNKFKENIDSDFSEVASSSETSYKSVDRALLDEDPDVTGVFVIEDLSAKKQQLDFGGIHQTEKNASKPDSTKWKDGSADNKSRPVSRNLMTKSPFCKQPLKDQNRQFNEETPSKTRSKKEPRLTGLSSPELWSRCQRYVPKNISSPAKPVFKCFKPDRNRLLIRTTDEPTNVRASAAGGIIGRNDSSSKNPSSDVKTNLRKSISTGSLSLASNKKDDLNTKETLRKARFSKSEQEFENICKMRNDNSVSPIEVVVTSPTFVCQSFDKDQSPKEERSPSFMVFRNKYNDLTSTDGTFMGTDSLVVQNDVEFENKEQEEKDEVIVDKNEESFKNNNNKRRSIFQSFTTKPMLSVYEEEPVVNERDLETNLQARDKRRSVLPTVEPILPCGAAVKFESDSEKLGTVVNQDKYNSVLDKTLEEDMKFTIKSNIKGVERLYETKHLEEANKSGDNICGSGGDSDEDNNTETFIYNESICNETLKETFCIKSNKKLSVIDEETNSCQLNISTSSSDLHLDASSSSRITSVGDTTAKKDVKNCKKTREMMSMSETSKKINNKRNIPDRNSVSKIAIRKLEGILENYRVAKKKNEEFAKKRNELVDKLKLEQEEFFRRQNELMITLKNQEDKFVNEQNNSFIQIVTDITNVVVEINSGSYTDDEHLETSFNLGDRTLVEEAQNESTVKKKAMGDDSYMMNNSTVFKTPTDIRKTRSNMVYSQLKSDFSCLKTPNPSTVKKTLDSTLNRTILTPQSMSVCIQEQVNRLFHS